MDPSGPAEYYNQAFVNENLQQAVPDDPPLYPDIEKQEPIAPHRPPPPAPRPVELQPTAPAINRNAKPIPAVSFLRINKFFIFVKLKVVRVLKILNPDRFR